jgi:hypothetical protein
MQPLCNIGDLRAWLTLDVGTDDVLLARLRDAVSADFLRIIDRPADFVAADYTDVVTGDDTAVLVLDHWPVNAITSITDSNGNAITASANGILAGWHLRSETDPERLCSVELIPASTGDTVNTPSTFSSALKYSIVYNAGYVAQAIVDELANIPAAPGPYTISPINVIDFLSDTSVKFSVSGTALVKVAANPATGQYSVSDEGVYTFAAADTGLAVKISYKLIAGPKDIRQAVVDWAAYRYRSRMFIGQNSKHLQTGETVTYQQMEMPMSTAAVLERYSRNLVRMI